MSVIDDAPEADVPQAEELRLGEVLGNGAGRDANELGDGRPLIEEEMPAEVEVSPLVVSASAFLASAAAAWVMAGVFEGLLARLVGLLGAAIGAGVVAGSYRFRKPNTVQFLVVPLAAIVGALLVLPDASGGGASLPSLVVEAIRGGGLGSPPVPFDPGWRFLLVVVTAVLGAASASLGVSYARPRLGVLLAVPLILGGILMQPPGAVTVSAMVALVLAIGALAVSFGAELAKEGATSGRFELRRLSRGAAVLVGLVVLLTGFTKIGFLFPEPNDTRVIPPKRPETPPAEPDREIFRVASDFPMPWRLGVLDVYGTKESAWLTPPHDPRRFVEPGRGGVLPEGLPEDVAVPRSGPTFTATFEISDVRGHVIPVVQGATKVTGVGVEYDPRTQTLRLPGRARKGDSYRVEAPVPPDAAALNKAPEPRAELKQYLEAPDAPQEVRDLLGLAPKAGLYERLQFVRTQFYSRVVAAGAGNPIDVPPSRVVDMLEGKEATPYEITAAEALLARWAGVPARIGYGYYGGDTKPGDTSVSIRPRHGATWLEAYFEGHGWVPIVGRPPKAKSSANANEKNRDESVRATDQLALQVYVPLRQQSITLLYSVVRFWLARAVPLLLTLLLLVVGYPGVLKAARSVLRRRWARERGPRSRVAVAYSEFRDIANDFGFGHPTLTPIQFLDAVVPDKELRELTWLTSRGLWGDLMRDLRDEDADAAEEMARSVIRRLARAQSPLLRALRFSSRVSLRQPYDDEMPNLWPHTTPLARVRRVLGRLRLRRLRGIAGRVLRRPAVATAAVVVVAALLTGGCAQKLDFDTPAAASALENPPVPDELGGYRFVRESAAEAAFDSLADVSLVSRGRVYSVREGEAVQASLQIAWFKPGLSERGDDLRKGVLRRLENGNFELTRLNDDRVYIQRLPEQTMALWFAPDTSHYVLMVARLGFDPAPLFVSLLAHQRGEAVDGVQSLTQVPPVDPIRGSE